MCTKKRPLSSVRLELWDSAENYFKYGMGPVQKFLWKLLNRPEYDRIMGLIEQKRFCARGIWDRYRRTVALCMKDITLSYAAAMGNLSEEEHGETNHEFSFGLQFYYTLIHELLHASGVEASHCADGHKINFDKYEKLDPWLKRLFDGLLALEDSGDAFRKHPENRRD